MSQYVYQNKIIEIKDEFITKICKVVNEHISDNRYYIFFKYSLYVSEPTKDSINSIYKDENGEINIRNENDMVYHLEEVSVELLAIILDTLELFDERECVIKISNNF